MNETSDNYIYGHDDDLDNKQIMAPSSSYTNNGEEDSKLPEKKGRVDRFFARENGIDVNDDSDDEINSDPNKTNIDNLPSMFNNQTNDVNNGLQGSLYNEDGHHTGMMKSVNFREG